MTETVPRGRERPRVGSFRLWPHLAGAGVAALMVGVAMSVGGVVAALTNPGPGEPWFLAVYNLAIFTFAASLPVLLAWLPLDVLLQRSRLDGPAVGLLPGAAVGLGLMWLSAEGLPTVIQALIGVTGGAVVGFVGRATVRSAQSRARAGWYHWVLIGVLLLSAAVMTNHFVQMAIHSARAVG